MKIELSTLTNKKVITSNKQVGEIYGDVYYRQKNASKDLDNLKKAIKENEAYDWFKHGIILKLNHPQNNFSKDRAIVLITKLMKELNKSDKQISLAIDKLTIRNRTKKIEPYTK